MAVNALHEIGLWFSVKGPLRQFMCDAFVAVDAGFTFVKAFFHFPADAATFSASA